ncbi:hypothetical protein [Aeromonas salmonicida]
MKEIEQLCQALIEKRFKSKQVTFNYHYDDFCAAKGLYGWERVTKYINEVTGAELAVAAYKSMLKRAKKKTESSPQPETKKTTTNAFSSIVKKEKLEHNNNPDLDELIASLKAGS